MILKKLGIYGWSGQDENLALASILTGDPLLLIGNHGCAKTYLANRIAEALGKKFLVYDASKAMFEDVLGYPNVEKLKQGIVEYIPSKITVWDKEFILIDELNRAIPELQSKWLELIRSRKIMGYETKVKWVWSAMNPMTYSATQTLDEALIGRFAIFLYPPDVLQMKEEDRIKITMSINGDDAPGIAEWTQDRTNGKSISIKDISEIGKKMSAMLKRAARYFNHLKEEMLTLSEFLAKFASLLMRETKQEISLDGRRLGFIYRNILAARSVELAKSEIFHTEYDSFAESARYVVQSSIPIGLTENSPKREESVHKIEICFDLLSSFFDKDSEIHKINKIYELFTTNDLMRKAEILITENLGEFVSSKAWTDMINSDEDITILSYTALKVEARRPGTLPQELIENLSQKISGSKLSTDCIPNLQGDSVEYIEEIESLLNRYTDLEKIIAYNRAEQLSGKENITIKDIEETGNLIEQDIKTFERLITKGGE